MKATIVNVTMLRWLSQPIAFLTATTFDNAIQINPVTRAISDIGQAGISISRKKSPGEDAKKTGRARLQKSDAPLKILVTIR